MKKFIYVSLIFLNSSIFPMIQSSRLQITKLDEKKGVFTISINKYSKSPEEEDWDLCNTFSHMQLTLCKKISSLYPQQDFNLISEGGAYYSLQTKLSQQNVQKAIDEVNTFYNKSTVE